MLVFSIIALAIICLTNAEDYHHQSSIVYQLSPGWQEPGLWRPKWIMERSFDATKDKPAYRDRLYFKLRADKAVVVYRSEARPQIEIGQPPKKPKKIKQLFETGLEQKKSLEDQMKEIQKESEQMRDEDGAWMWSNAQPVTQGGVIKIETKEGPLKEKIRHDGRFLWGKVDQYAAQFRSGKMYKYKITKQGIPTGDYKVGTYSIHVSPHRPLVSRDFLAFQ